MADTWSRRARDTQAIAERSGFLALDVTNPIAIGSIGVGPCQSLLRERVAIIDHFLLKMRFWP